MLALQDTALDVAEELILTGEDKIRATMVVAILDRTGLGPKSTISVEKQADLSHLTDEELAAQVDALSKQVRVNETRRRMNEAMMTPQHRASDSRTTKPN